MIHRITVLALCACAALPLRAEVYRAPVGCEAFLTVQMRSCGASLYWRCYENPEITWELHADSEGPFSLSVFDSEFQWLDTLIYLDGTRERLLAPAPDPASLSELLETGIDTYEFVVADVERSSRFYRQMMDVPEVARLDAREAAKRGEDAVIFAPAS